MVTMETGRFVGAAGSRFKVANRQRHRGCFAGASGGAG